MTTAHSSDCTGCIQAQTIEDAGAAFLRSYPAYARTRRLDDLRTSEYGRLDAQGQVYLDYTGGGMYAESQLHEHLQLLRHNTFGNPHSHNPTSQAMTDLVERARCSVLRFFNASPDEYVAIFTPNASGALKLVGEAYAFAAGDRLLLTADNHNSVNGIREFARARGAGFAYAPVVAPELRLDARELARLLSGARPGGNNLFAFPAQSNYSGVQHPLKLIAQARDQGWDVLVDCAAFAPSNRLDMTRWQPDFVPLSFYKMMGYPTGVGCLLVRRPALAKLQRPWFAGGTITIASALAGRHYLAPAPASFEDGTVNYLNLPAVEIGLRHISSIGIDTIHERVRCLTGWLLDTLRTLRHSTGQPLMQLHGPWDMTGRGGTIAGNYLDRNGCVIDPAVIEHLAGRARISLRTGCFCNPGAGEAALGLSKQHMDALFALGHSLSFSEMGDFVKTRYGKTANAVRISVGLASNFADVHRFLAFAGALLNRTCTDLAADAAATAAPRTSMRDSP